jgi:hypothetical protein
MSLQTGVATAMLKANVLMKAKYAHEPPNDEPASRLRSAIHRTPIGT